MISPESTLLSIQASPQLPSHLSKTQIGWSSSWFQILQGLHTNPMVWLQDPPRLGQNLTAHHFHHPLYTGLRHAELISLGHAGL